MLLFIHITTVIVTVLYRSTILVIGIVFMEVLIFILLIKIFIVLFMEVLMFNVHIHGITHTMDIPIRCVVAFLSVVVG